MSPLARAPTQILERLPEGECWSNQDIESMELMNYTAPGIEMRGVFQITTCGEGSYNKCALLWWPSLHRLSQGPARRSGPPHLTKCTRTLQRWFTAQA